MYIWLLYQRMFLVRWFFYLAKHCLMKKFCIVDCKWTGDNLYACEGLRPDLNMFEIHWYEDSHIKNTCCIWHLNFCIEFPHILEFYGIIMGKLAGKGAHFSFQEKMYCASEFIGYRYVNCRNERFIATRHSFAGPHMNKLQHWQQSLWLDLVRNPYFYKR